MNIKISSFIPPILLLCILFYSYYTTRDIKDRKKANQLILQNVIQIYVPFTSLFFFVGHIFMGEKVAKSIGWKGGSGFQKEVAFAAASYGIAALYSYINPNINVFKTIAISVSAFAVGTVLVHLDDAVKRHNFSFNNVIAAPLGSIFKVVTLAYLVTHS